MASDAKRRTDGERVARMLELVTDELAENASTAREIALVGLAREELEQWRRDVAAMREGVLA